MLQLAAIPAANRMYAKLALVGFAVAAVAFFCGHQYLSRTAAEKRAQAADTARAEAVAEAAGLRLAAEAQNAAVQLLAKQLSSKQAAVKQAEAEAQRIARDTARQLEHLRTAPVPRECTAAMEWLRQQMEDEGGQ